MKHSIFSNKRFFSIVAGLFIFLLALPGQDYSNGVKNGAVLVKFKPNIIKSEKGLEVTYKKGVARTRIERVDQLNTTYGTLNMKRVFPYSPKYEARHQKHGLHLWYELELDTTGAQALSFGKKETTLNAIEAYNALSEIEYAEPVRAKMLVEPFTVNPTTYTKSASGVSEGMPYNDPLLSSQWHYDNTGQTGGAPNEDIRLFDAWAISSGSPNVIVSVHDQGVDTDHQDLSDNMWINEAELNGEPNFDDDGNGYKDDIYGFNFADNFGDIPAESHGTHVAGTISAVNNNGIGVAGVAGGTGNNDGVKIMSCRIIGGRSWANTPDSYVYAADNGALISQNSWGYQNVDQYEQVVLDAIDYFIAEAGNFPGSLMRGGIVICASGNDNTQGKHYPGAYESCIAVSALDANSHKAPYSNYGDWIDISAPGGSSEGDTGAGDSIDFSNEVLSTLPDDSYGYLKGTSMACPHVSGIAALVVSNFGSDEFTSNQLEAHILTGVRDYIYDFAENEPYAGSLGSGASDASFALDTDEGLPPFAISDLSLKYIAQDEASLEWSVPSDPDDELPYKFEVLHSLFEINDGTLDQAISALTRNVNEVGEIVTFDISGLKAVTEYHFSVRSIDRWGNISDYSNVVIGTTTEGPVAKIDTSNTLIELTIDMDDSAMGSDTIMLYNYGEGVLRWDAETRHVSASPLSRDNPTNLQYPELNTAIYSLQSDLSVVPLNSTPVLYNIDQENNEEMSYLDPESANFWAIGETDTTFTNSSATRFYVSQDQGFNLTHLDVKLYNDPEKGPVIVEVYSGESISNASLMLAQEFYETTESWDHVELNEHIYFEKGSYFWTVFHVPAGNLYPLGAGLETNREDSENCYLSNNLGKSWFRLEDAYYDNQIVWAVYAMSRYENIGEYIQMAPQSGKVLSMDSVEIVASVNAAEMINGGYMGSVVIQTNEPDNPIIRIPADITVKGHKPELTSPPRNDFGGVMLGTDKTISVKIQNAGYGRFNYSSIEISDSQFEYVSGKINTFEAKTEQTLIFRFTPDRNSSSYANVTINQTDGDDYSFQLFGVGYEPPVAKLVPESDTFNLFTGYSLSIGDTIHGDFILKNEGSYPLDYYMPAYADGSNMEEVPEDIHKFGYIARMDSMGINPEYTWEEISETGIDVTEHLSGNEFDKIFYETDLGFDFPFFGKKENSLHITRYGLVSFDTEGSIWSRFPLYYKSSLSPDRFISAWGIKMDFTTAGFGKVFYKRHMDRFIVQYDSIPFEDGWHEGAYATFQIVLHENGNINIYYKDVNVPPYVTPWFINDILQRFSNISIEDQTKDDGILIHDQNYQNYSYRNGSVLEFINPGLGSIYDVSNTFGTIDPGDSILIDYSINTDSLFVQEYNETLPIVTNDPFHNPLLFLVNFDISAGGVSELEINETALNFEQVFQYDSVTLDLVFENTGKATDSLLSASFDKDNFKIYGSIPQILKPRRSLYYPVSIVSGTLGTFTDTLRVRFKSGQEFKISLEGDIVSGPEILVDPTSLSATTGSGKSVNKTINISNTGDYDLQLSPMMTDWISVEKTIPESYDTLDIDYVWETSLVEGGPTYEWIEIADTGTKITGLEGWYGIQYTEGIALPFTFNYYGIDYDTIYIGFSGLVTFTGDQGGEYAFGGPNIPHHSAPNNYIAPLWVGGGTDYDVIYPKTGQYYYIDDDKIIVEWRDYINGFAMGEPISFQVILYKNNKIKFQYLTPETSDLNFTPEYSTIGVENHDASRGEEISFYSGLINQDMAISVYPVKEYTIPVDGSQSFEVTLDATELYAGEYESELVIVNSDPLNKNLEIPVTFAVTGKEQIVIPDSIYFGDLFVIESEVNPYFTQYEKEFQFENPGTDVLSINKFTQTFADDVLVEAYVYAPSGLGFNSWGWHPVIQQNPWDMDITPILLEPNKTLKLRARITPEEAADLDHNLVIATSLGTKQLPIVASAYFPPFITVDQDSIIIFTNDKTLSELRSFQIENVLGGYPLDYNISIEFGRQEASPEPEAVTKSTGSNPAVFTENLSLQSLEFNPSQNSRKSAQVSLEESDRVLSHDNKTSPNSNIGYGGGMSFHTATRFFAPMNGFNLTHVQTWYAPGSWLNSEIKVRIYGGSRDIYQSELVHEEIFSHVIDDPDDGGQLLTLQLSDSIIFYPNEPFFIEFGYDATIDYPQGWVSNIKSTEGQFMYGTSKQWYDVQDAGEDFQNSGWMVRAVEKFFENSAWVTLQSPASGTVNSVTSNTVDLRFDAPYANPGKNYAKLNILSNDPIVNSKTVDLLLWVNGGPVIEVDKTSFTMLESETLVITATAVDLEGDNFTMSLSSMNPFIRSEFVNNELIITCTPDYGDQGIYDIEISAVDDYNNGSSFIINLEVLNVNRPPVPVSIDDIHLRSNASYYLLTASEMFHDPDGDELMIIAVSEDESVTTVFASGKDLLLAPQSAGNSRVSLSATDIYEAGAENAFNTIISNPNGIDNSLAGEISVFPNPIIDKCRIETSSISGDVRLELVNFAGKVLKSFETTITGGNEISLDLSDLPEGAYTLRIQNDGALYTKSIIKI